MVTPGGRGFSMIELMVVLAIGALLMLVAAPLTKTWVDNATVRQTTFRLQEGMSQAKALALRNVGGRTVAEPAAYLVLTVGQACVFTEAPEGLSCEGKPAWQAPFKAAVQMDGKTSGCIALNNQALSARGAAIGDSACGSGSYVVSYGNGRYPQDGSQSLF